MRWFRLICIALVVFDITTTILFSVVAMKERTRDTIKRTESQISEYIKSVWNLGDAIAAAPATRDNSLSLRQRAQMLIPYADAYDLFMLGITNEKGLLGSTLERKQITSTAMLNDEGVGDLSSRPAFQEMMATGKSILTDTYLAGADATTMIYTIWIPYYVDGEIAGAITVSIKFAFIDNIIRSTSLEDNYYFSLIDSRNIISSNPDTDTLGKPVEEAYQKSKWVSIPLQKLTKDWEDGRSGGYWGIRNGRLEYVAYMPVTGTPWKLIMRTDFFGSFRNTFYSLAIKMAVYLSLIALFSLRKNREIFTRERLFNMMTGNVDEVFFAYNTAREKLEYVSGNALRVLGISAEDWLADPRKAASTLGLGFESAKNNVGENAYYIDMELYNPQANEKRPFRVRIYKMREDGVEWAVMVLTDETEEQEKKRVIQEALSTAEQASRAKSEFLTSMSHDIRTPMNAIVGMSTIAMSNLDDKNKVADCLKKVTLSSQHLLDLINDVLDMSRIESGKLILNDETFDLKARLRELREMLQAMAAAKQINLCLELGEIRHSHVYGDVLRINQILINLINNALKFTDKGGQVGIIAEELAWEKEEYSLYKFSIKDNGIGIEPEFMDRLFNPFERVERSTISKTEGAGLGLAIVKRLVNLMDGRIQVESAPGKGSCFTVLLPLKWGNYIEDELSQEEPAQLKAKSFKQSRILLAEDNELNMEIARELLEMAGLSVDAASNGEEALKKFEESPVNYYDMVITDIQMPHMDGYEEARAIRALNRADAGAVPIIAMTADAFQEAKDLAMSAGMNGYITKPVSLPQLMDTLEKWLEA